MANHWLDRAKKLLEAEANQPSGPLFERLQLQGIINERGEVTGKLHRWDAFLAITAVNRAIDNRRIGVFRCLKPVFGLPGHATIDISRDAMVTYLKEGKKVITARWDDRLSMWREGCAVLLSANGFLLCESAADNEDNVGGVPEFQQAGSQS
jgi:hypothetical protein